MRTKRDCPEFSHFGAHYPDATCIDGYLWDLDSCEEPGGPLFSGGDDPCPFCNGRAAIRVVRSREHTTWLVARERVNRLRKKFGFSPLEPKERSSS